MGLEDQGFDEGRGRKFEGGAHNVAARKETVSSGGKKRS